MKKLTIICVVLLISSLTINGQSTATNQVSKFTIKAPQLGTEKTIWVYLPKSYHTSDIQYPVIYMLDGQNLFDAKTSYVGEWNIDEYLDTLTTNESIIIGIEHGNDKRIEELTPYPHKEYGGGKGNLFAEFIKNTVKPYVDKTYRTLPEYNNTTIFGSSLGGLLAFYALIQHSDTFGKAGIFSPAFWVNPEIKNLPSTVPLNKEVYFYFLAGTEESDTMISNIEDMIAILIHKGINPNHIKNSIVEGGQHNEKLWRTNFPEAYQWLRKTKDKNKSKAAKSE